MCNEKYFEVLCLVCQEHSLNSGLLVQDLIRNIIQLVHYTGCETTLCIYDRGIYRHKRHINRVRSGDVGGQYKCSFSCCILL